MVTPSPSLSSTSSSSSSSSSRRATMTIPRYAPMLQLLFSSSWWLVLLALLPCGCHSEEIPVDYFIELLSPSSNTIGGLLPSSYKSSSSWTPRRVSFDKLYMGLYNMTYDPNAVPRQRYDAASRAVPSSEPVIVDVLVFHATPQDLCQKFDNDEDDDGGFWGDSAEQCFLTPERMIERGIGVQLPKNKNTTELSLGDDGKESDGDDDDDDDENVFHLCCTEQLVQMGKCTSGQLGTLLLDPDLFTTTKGIKHQHHHLQWTIPVGATHVPKQDLAQTSVSLKGGKFMILLSTCSKNPYVDDDGDDETKKKQQKKNDIALYMKGSILDFPWTLLGLWPFEIVLMIAYGSTLVWYGIQVLHKGDEEGREQQQGIGVVTSSQATQALASERWICLILLLSFAETSLNLALWAIWNARSSVPLVVACIPYLLNVSKMILSFVLGLRLAQAAGTTPNPADGPVSDHHQRPAKSQSLLTAIMVLYGIASFAHKWTEWSFLLAFRLERAPWLGYLTILSLGTVAWFFLTCLSIVMVAWMVIAVSRTITYFESIQTDRANLRRYVRLRYIFVLSAVASGATFASTSAMMPFLYTASTTQIYISMLHDVFYFATLLGIAYLWQPRANRLEYNYLTSLLLDTPMEHDNVGNDNAGSRQEQSQHPTDLLEFVTPSHGNEEDRGDRDDTALGESVQSTEQQIV